MPDPESGKSMPWLREIMLSAIQAEYGRLPEVAEEESAWLGSAESRRHDTETTL